VAIVVRADFGIDGEEYSGETCQGRGIIFPKRRFFAMSAALVAKMKANASPVKTSIPQRSPLLVVTCN